MTTYRSYSSDETKRLGEKLAQQLKEPRAESREPRKRAVVFALQGDLGAGKTTFVQGFLKGLGIKKRATSPTFIIMRRYKVPISALGSLASPKRFAKASRLSALHHMDAYRLRKAEDINPLGFKEILTDPKNILLVEWPENIKGALPRGTHNIIFKYGKKENERIIKF